MGVAVILFTIAFRILWLPISLASGRSYKEKLAIAKKISEVEEAHKNDPVRKQVEVKSIFKGNRRIVVMSAVNILLQTVIALMLYRIFSNGLKGDDFHLLYGFMPEITEPFNLIFLGKYDLTMPNLTLNLVQSLAIFVFETLSAVISMTITSREVVMTQLALPVVSFLVFINLPAGKKLFIITTLLFSIVLIIVRQLYDLVKNMGNKLDQMAQKAAGIEPDSQESSLSSEKK